MLEDDEEEPDAIVLPAAKKENRNGGNDAFLGAIAYAFCVLCCFATTLEVAPVRFNRRLGGGHTGYPPTK